MSTTFKGAFVGAAVAALSMGATVMASSAFAAPYGPARGSDMSPDYPYEDDYSYTDPDGMFGNHGGGTYDTNGNCIGHCDF